MALSDAIKSEPARRPSGIPCSVAELADRLQGAELDAFNAMMYELGWSAERIYRAVAAEGHYVGKQTINRHRSQSCRCYL